MSATPGPRVLVIGGGAAGLLAAGRAAECGASVLVLEKMGQLARKLCITGKGRCNISNSAKLDDFMAHFPGTGTFLKDAFQALFSKELVALLEKHGLPTDVERGGRIFPKSGKAPDVKAALLRWLKPLDVSLRENAKVQKLLVENGKVTGLLVDGTKIPGDAVILATGGKSYPATGSTGDGYRLAGETGHRIVPVRPALVPLETAGRFTGRMKDLNLRNVEVDLLVDGKRVGRQFGELTFAPFGVTGPTILTLSSQAVDALDRKRAVSIRVDLKPALDEKKLDARILRDFEKRSGEPMHSVLRGLIPGPLVPVCLGATRIHRDRKPPQVPAADRRKIRDWLKSNTWEISGHRGFAEAIVTAGGVDIRDVDPRSMASRVVSGLYIAGEILDVQGDTGGFNLQAAFSTGWLAGESAAQGRGHE